MHRQGWYKKRQARDEKEKQSPEQKEAEEMALNILSKASGKNPKYIRMLLKGKSESKAVQREKFIENLNNVTDEITVAGLDPSYSKYFDITKFAYDENTDHTDNLNLIEQALNIIENGYKNQEDKIKDYDNEFGEYLEKTSKKYETKFNKSKTLDELLDILNSIENESQDVQEAIGGNITKSFKKNYERLEKEEIKKWLGQQN